MNDIREHNSENQTIKNWSDDFVVYFSVPKIHWSIRCFFKKILLVVFSAHSKLFCQLTGCFNPRTNIFWALPETLSSRGETFLSWTIEFQAFQWILCAQAKNCLCKEVFSKITWAIYCVTFVIIFSFITMVYRRVIYFIYLNIIEYYQKSCGWNSKSTKTKNYATNYTKYNYTITQTL